MSIFSKSKGEPRVTYERFELPMDPPFPEPEASPVASPVPALQPVSLQPASVQPASVQPTSEWRPAGPEPTTLLIPADSVAEGVLRSQGLIRIEGILRGEVHAPTILLTASGRIEGSAYANIVTVMGILHGAVVAREIELSRTASVDAEMTYDDISIERGARVRGLHRQREAESAVTLAPSAPAPAPVPSAVTSNLTTEAEAALQDLAEVAGAAAKAAADLATDGMRSLVELEAHLRATGSQPELIGAPS